MVLLISTVFFHTFPVSPVILVYIFTTAFFAPTPQPIFAAEPFAKLTLVFPFFAFGALLHSCLLIYVSLLIPPRQPLLDSIFVLYRLLFLRPNLNILFFTAPTVLPIWSAISCAVLLG